MKLRTLLPLFAFSLIICMSCGSDDDVDCDGNDFEQELASEINAVSNAAIDYSTDPSSSNCNAFKAAYDDFIDALRPYRNCAFDNATKQEFDDQLEAAEAAIDQLSC